MVGCRSIGGAFVGLCSIGRSGGLSTAFDNSVDMLGLKRGSAMVGRCFVWRSQEV